MIANDFLSLRDFSPEQVRHLLDLAADVKADRRKFSKALEGQTLIIVLLNIMPEHQGRSVARRMLDIVCERARLAGCTQVAVSTTNTDRFSAMGPLSMNLDSHMGRVLCTGLVFSYFHPNASRGCRGKQCRSYSIRQHLDQFDMPLRDNIAHGLDHDRKVDAFGQIPRTKQRLGIHHRVHIHLHRLKLVLFP